MFGLKLMHFRCHRFLFGALQKRNAPLDMLISLNHTAGASRSILMGKVTIVGEVSLAQLLMAAVDKRNTIDSLLGLISVLLPNVLIY